MTEQQVIELIPEYVLGLLNDKDSALVEAHLESSERVRSELESYNHTLDVLALNTPLVDLPLTLKADLFEALEQRDTAPVSRQNGQKSAVAAHTAAPAVQTRSVKLEPAKRSWLRGWLLPAFLTISVIANIVLIGALISQPEPEAVVEVEAPTMTPEAPLIDTTINRISLVNNSNTEHGVIILSDDGQHGTLVVNGLPELEEGQQYKIWLSDGGNVHSGGLFVVAPNGYASVSVDAPLPLNAYSEFGIQLETAGGAAGDDLILHNADL